MSVPAHSSRAPSLATRLTRAGVRDVARGERLVHDEALAALAPGAEQTLPPRLAEVADPDQALLTLAKLAGAVRDDADLASALSTALADDDVPASNQGFHCGALMAAQELGLPVSNEDIDRAKFGDRGVAQAIDLRLIGDVAEAGRGAMPGFARDSVGGLTQPPLVKVRDQHPRAFLGGALGDRETDAGSGGGGDDDRLPTEQAARRRIDGVQAHLLSPRISRGSPRPRSAIRLR